MPAQLFYRCQAFLWNEKHKASFMRCISYLSWAISKAFHFIPRLFHFYPGIYFIASPAIFLFYFISTLVFISLPPQPYFFSISFLPWYLFHCLPNHISFLFHSYPGIYFIASLALFHFHPGIYFIGCPDLFLFCFIPTQVFISLLL